MGRARPWTVLPHGPLETLEPNLRAVEGSLPRGPMPRRMSVVRLADGRLVLLNAVPLREPEMRELEGWGVPAFVVVPNRFHRLDLAAWKARYPGCAFVCPRPAARAVAEVVPVEGGLELLPRDPAVEAVTLDGTRTGEPVLVVRSGGAATSTSTSPRVSLLFGDALMNLPHVPGVGGLLLRVLGSSGGPKVTPLARMLMASDRRALARHLARLADAPGLVRLVPSHGEIVAERAAAVLRQVAGRLAA